MRSSLRDELYPTRSASGCDLLPELEDCHSHTHCGDDQSSKLPNSLLDIGFGREVTVRAFELVHLCLNIQHTLIHSCHVSKLPNVVNVSESHDTQRVESQTAEFKLATCSCRADFAELTLNLRSANVSRPHCCQRSSVAEQQFRKLQVVGSIPTVGST